MKRIVAIIAVLTAAFAVSCKKAEDTSPPKVTVPPKPATPLEEAKQVMGTLVGHMETAVKALEGVTDKASAEKAAETIRKVNASLTELSGKAHGMDAKLSEADKTTMEKEAEAKMTPIMGRMTTAMAKVMANEEMAAVLRPVMDEFSKAMAGPQPAAPAGK